MCSQFRSQPGAEGGVEGQSSRRCDLLAPPVGVFGHDALDPGDLGQDSRQLVQRSVAAHLQR